MPYPQRGETGRASMSYSRKDSVKARHSIALRAVTNAIGIFLVGCSASSANVASPTHVAAAPPPKDDGKSAEGGRGGSEHSSALEQLKIAPVTSRSDKMGALRIPLPDAQRWTRVKFWGVPSTVGFRYGKDHHAVVAGFITHVDDNTVQGACLKSFEDWATPWIEAFDADVTHEPPLAFSWKGSIVDVDVLTVKSETLAQHDTYSAAYAGYPAWKGACLIVGIAIPARDDLARSREVRDRYASELLPKVEVTTDVEPKEQF